MSVLDNAFGLPVLVVSALMAATGASMPAGNEGRAKKTDVLNHAESIRVSDPER
jgi:hypothetical protein